MALLDDYASIARRRGTAHAEQTALRMRSDAIRDLFAHIASNGQRRYDDIVTAADMKGLALDPRWATALGRVVGLQALHPQDLVNAIHLLEVHLEDVHSRHRSDYRKLLAEFLFVTGDFERAHSHIVSDPALSTLGEGYLLTDLLNPFSASPFADRDEWYQRFISRFTIHGLSAPTFNGDTPTIFDRVDSAGGLEPASGPLVSVILTTFRPERHALFTSIRSVLQQTWQDIELIIVDDCSPPEYQQLLDEVAALDSRIHLVRCTRNGGTYAARNAGMRVARGEYFTGQDDDDWSHPERIAKQMVELASRPDVAALRSRSIPVFDNLVMQRPGYPENRGNPSSLLVRRDTINAIGGFLPSRRGADTELHLRIQQATGKRVVTLATPLALVRIREASLSRTDFRIGWTHPARRAFREAFGRWHDTHEPGETAVFRDGESPVPIPTRFSVQRSDPQDLDVVLVGDWRRFGGPQKSMIEEIRALRSAGKRVGILHLEAARFMTKRNDYLCEPILDLINQREVTRVIDDDVTHARLAILRYPPILQFPPAVPLGLHAERLVILANQAPSERDGTDIRYDVRQCADNAEDLFGLRGLWVPQGPTVRSAIEEDVPDGELASFDIPGILNIDEWMTDRKVPRSTVPVIGRHSRDDPMKWPETAELIRTVYPIDGSVDVRLMGGHRTVLDLLEMPHVPSSWVCFETNELDVRTFLNSIDFFVYFQHSQAYDAFGRAVLEALATGCVAILPHHFSATFGDAALYAEPIAALALINHLYQDPAAMREQSLKAMAYVREAFSHERYVDLVSELLDMEALVNSGTREPRVG